MESAKTVYKCYFNYFKHGVDFTPFDNGETTFTTRKKQFFIGYRGINGHSCEVITINATKVIEFPYIKDIIGMAKVHAFLICNNYFLWHEHWVSVFKGTNFEDQSLRKRLRDKNGDETSTMWEKFSWNYGNW